MGKVSYYTVTIHLPCGWLEVCTVLACGPMTAVACVRHMHMLTKGVEQATFNCASGPRARQMALAA